MKLAVTILSFLLAGCTPNIIPVVTTKTGIEVSFTNEIKSDFKIQVQQNKTWITVKEYKGLPTGTHTDTLNYVVGLYRVWCPLDSTQIINIK